MSKKNNNMFTEELLKNYQNGIIPLNADEKYEEIVYQAKVGLFKPEMKWCEECKKPQEVKCIYHATYKKWFCEQCLKHRFLFESVMEGLNIKWKETHYGNSKGKKNT